MNIMHLLTSFQGRIRRMHFWLGLLGIIVVFGVLYSILASMSGMASGSPNGLILALMGVLYLVYLYVWAAIMVKRAHDRDKTGWFVLIILIPLIGAIWILIELGFLDGTQGPNKYGPSPKGIGDASATVAAQ
ncbi:MAG TPA: DUF805 domain-containing protein [Caulobacteraceae bacterium]|nr:DUF805 domain-containing protein [Caulobacteraceae bacterium]